MADRMLNAADAARLRGNGTPDIAGYKSLLNGLDDGQMLRMMINGDDSATVEEANFTRAAQELGIEVAFSRLREDDNIPYLVVTRNPNFLRAHLPGE